jgi:hypothetical protein
MTQTLHQCFCGRTVKLTDLYFNRNGTVNSCKFCAKERSAKQIPKSKDEPSTQAEAHLIARLALEGIPAHPGKSSPWKQIDIVAYDVAIKVASSTEYKGGYQFGLRLEESWLIYDLIALQMKDDPETFYLFRSDDPIFFHSNGKRKQGLKYTPKATWIRKDNDGLNDDNMREARNRYSLIERIKLEKSAQLKHKALAERATAIKVMGMSRKRSG